ncbi:unnamed protein product [Sphagnum jensenii]
MLGPGDAPSLSAYLLSTEHDLEMAEESRGHDGYTRLWMGERDQGSRFQTRHQALSNVGGQQAAHRVAHQHDICGRILDRGEPHALVAGDMDRHVSWVAGVHLGVNNIGLCQTGRGAHSTVHMSRKGAGRGHIPLVSVYVHEKQRSPAPALLSRSNVVVWCSIRASAALAPEGGIVVAWGSGRYEKRHRAGRLAMAERARERSSQSGSARG